MIIKCSSPSNWIFAILQVLRKTIYQFSVKSFHFKFLHWFVTIFPPLNITFFVNSRFITLEKEQELRQTGSKLDKKSHNVVTMPKIPLKMFKFFWIYETGSGRKY